MPNTILDPTGSTAADHPPTDRPAFALAPRRTALDGVRVGLLDNTKHNALACLRELGRLLVEEHGAAEVSLVETKASFSVPVDAEIVGRYAAACDVVLTGVGDCGSCSAAAVADGINFERAGVPAAVILTDAFGTTGGAMARVQGVPDYAWITTQHPMAVLDEDQVRERAKQLLPEVVAALTEGEGAR